MYGIMMFLYGLAVETRVAGFGKCAQQGNNKQCKTRPAASSRGNHQNGSKWQTQVSFI